MCGRPVHLRLLLSCDALVSKICTNDEYIMMIVHTVLVLVQIWQVLTKSRGSTFLNNCTDIELVVQRVFFGWRLQMGCVLWDWIRHAQNCCPQFPERLSRYIRARPELEFRKPGINFCYRYHFQSNSSGCYITFTINLKPIILVIIVMIKILNIVKH